MEEYVDPFPLFFVDNEEINGVKFPCHKHPLFPTKYSPNDCNACRGSRPGGGYVCHNPDRERDCYYFFVHKSCLEITNPSHPTYPLRLSNSLFNCAVCLEYQDAKGYSYPFSGEVAVCKRCASKELNIDPKKSHEHPLFVLLKPFFSFPCDACGLTDDSSCLCLCTPCRFTIHRRCVNLPRVICINRHDDRISYVPRLGTGEWSCGVCRKAIDGRYGAYSCSSTCSFVSHSRCATRYDVWDGEDLEGVREDNPEDIIPFKKVGERVIKYFSHEHNLNFISEDDVGYDRNKQCHACVLPIFSDPCYVSIQGDFILHERCANLPRKKRHISHSKQFTLHTEPLYHAFPFSCTVCDQICSGFAYMVDNQCPIDLRCALIFDGYVHKSQPDSMLLARPRDCGSQMCSSCGKKGAVHLLELAGHTNLFMCYKCATMPAHVIYKHDAHPLSLRFIENATGDYWCEICEKKVDSQKWFYTCDECCTTLHIDCLLGDQTYLRVGSTFIHSRRSVWEVEVVSNNFASRPYCFSCKIKIVITPFFRTKSDHFVFCSLNCLGYL